MESGLLAFLLDVLGFVCLCCYFFTDDHSSLERFHFHCYETDRVTWAQQRAYFVKAVQSKRKDSKCVLT